MPENRLVIAGMVARPPRTRHNPAGVPLTSFPLEHRSRQTEAGMQREVYCRIIVMASGDELSRQAQVLRQGECVKVDGFLSQRRFQNAETRVVLHAQSIDRAPA